MEIIFGWLLSIWLQRKQTIFQRELIFDSEIKGPAIIRNVVKANVWCSSMIEFQFVRKLLIHIAMDCFCYFNGHRIFHSNYDKCLWTVSLR